MRPTAAVLGLRPKASGALRALVGAHGPQQAQLRPWAGAVSDRVVISPDHRLPRRARIWASLCLQRKLVLEEVGVGAGVASAPGALETALAAVARVPSPMHSACAVSPLFAELCAMQVDAVARSSGAAWHHPEAGRLIFHARSGWLSSDLPPQQLARWVVEPGWQPLHPVPELGAAVLASLESLIVLVCLRWRERLAPLPGSLRLSLRALPDVACVPMQPALLQALVALSMGRSLAASAQQSGVAAELASALATACALAGLVEAFSFDEDQVEAASVASAGSAPVATGLLRRLAVLLGLNVEAR